jgi:hypothetical protein
MTIIRNWNYSSNKLKKLSQMKIMLEKNSNLKLKNLTYRYKVWLRQID